MGIGVLSNGIFQCLRRLTNREKVARKGRLLRDPNESCFGYRASRPTDSTLPGKPCLRSLVMLVTRMMNGDEHIDIKQTNAQ